MVVNLKARGFSGDQLGAKRSRPIAAKQYSYSVNEGDSSEEELHQDTGARSLYQRYIRTIP